jgi:hypothetical protein
MNMRRRLIFNLRFHRRLEKDCPLDEKLLKDPSAWEIFKQESTDVEYIQLQSFLKMYECLRLGQEAGAEKVIQFADYLGQSFPVKAPETNALSWEFLHWVTSSCLLCENFKSIVVPFWMSKSEKVRAAVSKILDLMALAMAECQEKLETVKREVTFPTRGADDDAVKMHVRTLLDSQYLTGLKEFVFSWR